MKQEGKAIDGEKGEGSIDLDTYNPHSPSYMLGPPSPTSMEWIALPIVSALKIISERRTQHELKKWKLIFVSKDFLSRNLRRCVCSIEAFEERTLHENNDELWGEAEAWS